MKECWINIYTIMGFYRITTVHASLELAANLDKPKPLYRIHVRLKCKNFG